MQRILFLLLILFSTSALAEGALKVMNFNTMCFFCGNKKEYGTFKQRVGSIADTINRHQADVISLQESTFKGEVKDLTRRLKTDYHAVFYQAKVLSYVDPVLLVSKKRFDVIDRGSFWLGPNPKSPIGWKVTLPRRFQWVELFDKERQESFIFAGTHFDNSTINKNSSSVKVNTYLKKFNLPILFAGDTNIQTTMEGYGMLLGDLFNDSFPGTENVKFFANGPYTIHDACNIKKAPTFPQCRIDHVLTSKNAPWKVKSWGVDVYKYHGTTGFASDHRAVIVELE